MVTTVCPFCKKQIDYLRYSTTIIESGTFKVNGNNCSTYAMDNIDVDNAEYSCPICRKVITRYEKEARIFLNGEEVRMNAVI